MKPPPRRRVVARRRDAQLRQQGHGEPLEPVAEEPHLGHHAQVTQAALGHRRPEAAGVAVLVENHGKGETQLQPIQEADAGPELTGEAVRHGVGLGAEGLVDQRLTLVGQVQTHPRHEVHADLCALQTQEAPRRGCAVKGLQVEMKVPGGLLGPRRLAAQGAKHHDEGGYVAAGQDRRMA